MRRGLQITLYAAVLGGLAAASIGWTRVDKKVTVVVDGQAHQFSTVAATVQDALAAAQVPVSSHDLVAPALNARVHDGSRVVVRKGRELLLNINGQSRQIWTTEDTVVDALTNLGYSTADFSSVSRAKRLPLTPTAIDLRTPKSVTLRHDGHVQHLATTERTVGALLADAGVQLGKYDRISAKPSSALLDGLTIVINRVRKGNEVKVEPIPYPTQKKNDSSMDMGLTDVIQDGVDGSKRVTYSLVYVDGILAGRTATATTVLKPAVPKVIKIGTHPVTPQQIAEVMVADRGWSSSEYDCLVLLWNRESGWRVDASNPSGAYGIPQALPGSKMASVAADWQTNPRTQITWGLNYIASVYSTPCSAWSHETSAGWY